MTTVDSFHAHHLHPLTIPACRKLWDKKPKPLGFRKRLADFSAEVCELCISTCLQGASDAWCPVVTGCGCTAWILLNSAVNSIFLITTSRILFKYNKTNVAKAGAAEDWYRWTLDDHPTGHMREQPGWKVCYHSVFEWKKSSYGFEHRHNLKNPRVDQHFAYECQNWGVYRKSFLKAEGAPTAVGGIVLDNASNRVQQINRKTTGQKNEVYMYI